MPDIDRYGRGERERDGVGDAVEAQIERFAPGFRDLILARHLLTPADLQARDANLVNGDVGGGSYKKPSRNFSRTSGVSPGTFMKMSVATRPGQISVTRTILPYRSMRSWRDSMWIAALVAW